MMEEKTAEIPSSSVLNVNRWLRGALVFVLCILPFQNLPQTFLEKTDAHAPILTPIRYIDEVTVVISLFVLLSFALLRPSAHRIKGLHSGKFMMAFFLVALISLMLNQTPLLQGLFGTYDVLKNIVVLYVFFHAGFTKADINKLIGMLQKIAIAIGAVAILSEIVAMVWGVGIGYFVIEEKRLGLYRVVSLAGAGNWNYLGIYMTLMFFLTKVTMKPSWKRGILLLLILSTIFLTFSRQSWFCFGLMICALNKKLVPAGIVVLLVVLWMFIDDIEQLEPDSYFRTFALIESFRILRDNPLFGVGPGMFGGLAASIFGTPYYDHWPLAFADMAIRIRTIDMFWPSVWGEFGILGLLSYLSIWASIFLYLRRIRDSFLLRGDRPMCNLGKVLGFFMLALGVMGFGAGLNAAFVTFTYFALVGMYASAAHRASLNEP